MLPKASITHHPARICIPHRPCSIESALSYIVTHLSDISQLAAQTDRLDALLGALVQQTEGLPGGVRRWGGVGKLGGRRGHALPSQAAPPILRAGQHTQHTPRRSPAGSRARTAASPCLT